MSTAPILQEKCNHPLKRPRMRSCPVDEGILLPKHRASSAQIELTTSPSPKNDKTQEICLT